MPPHHPPVHVVIAVSLISIAFCATLGAMVGAWSWAIGRLRNGRPLLPDTGPRRVPWGLGSVLVVLLLWLAVNVVVSMLYFGRSAHAAKGWEPTATQQMEVVSLINLVLLVTIPPLLRLLSRARLGDLGISGRRLPGQALTGLMAFLLVTPAVYLLNFLAILIWEPNKHPVEKMMRGEPTAEVACLAFLSAVILAPAAEELIFRGVLQGWLTKFFGPGRDQDPDGSVSDLGELPEPIDILDIPSEIVDDSAEESVAMPISPRPDDEPPRGHPEDTAALAPSASRATVGLLPRRPGPRPGLFGVSWASIVPVVSTSAIFAAAHLPQWPAPLAIFALSIGLGFVYQRTGSLLASFVMHALFNGISTMLLFQQMLAGQPPDPKTVPAPAYVENSGPGDSSLTPPHLGVRKTFIGQDFSIGAGHGGG